MAFLIGPVVALLGLLILYVVLRTRAKTRTSLYTARRSLLQARTAERRDRALGGIPVLAPTAPAQASAATIATPDAAPAAPAAPGEQAWEQSPTRAQPGPPPPPPPLAAQPGGPVPDQPEAWPPATLPPPAPPPPSAFPEPAMPAAAAPAAPVDWPSSSAQVEPPVAAPGEEPMPVEPSMPAAEAPWAAVPNPAAEGFAAAPPETPAYTPAPPAYEPAAADAEPQVMPPAPDAAPAPEPVGTAPGRAVQSWSIVGQGGEEIPADSVAAGGTARAERAKKGEQKEGKRAPWDIIPHTRHKHEEVNLVIGREAPKETIGMTLLSYAGLVGALVVVLLGVLLMVATTR